jgi:hypothetical protein
LPEVAAILFEVGASRLVSVKKMGEDSALSVLQRALSFSAVPKLLDFLGMNT